MVGHQKKKFPTDHLFFFWLKNQRCRVSPVLKIMRLLLKENFQQPYRPAERTTVLEIRKSTSTYEAGNSKRYLFLRLSTRSTYIYV
jgi:hypothetical protein